MTDGRTGRDATPATGENTPITETPHVESEPARQSAARAPSAPTGASSGQDQIDDFVHGAYSQVVATVAIWSGSVDDAADAVADALGRAWEKIDRGQRIDNLAAFVTTTAMNRVRTQATRRAVFRRKRHLITVVGATESTEASIRRMDVTAALAQLTRRQRTVIALHYGSDLPVTEIAAHLGIAAGTVKATLHQARAALAERLEATEGEPDD